MTIVIFTFWIIQISVRIDSEYAEYSRNLINGDSIIRTSRVQWGSDIHPVGLDFEWLKRGWFANGSDLNEIWNLGAQPLKSRLVAAVWSKTVWNPDINFRILNGRDHSYTYSPTLWKSIWNPIFKKSRFWNIEFPIF